MIGVLKSKTMCAMFLDGAAVVPESVLGSMLNLKKPWLSGSFALLSGSMMSLWITCNTPSTMYQVFSWLLAMKRMLSHCRSWESVSRMLRARHGKAGFWSGGVFDGRFKNSMPLPWV